MFLFLLSSPTSPVPQRAVRGLAPMIIVVLVILVASLGYYQIIYYPPHHTSTTIQYVPPDPHNVTVVIVSGALAPCGASATPPQPASQCVGRTYVPDNITVVIGYNATVIWINNDTTVHTVTAQPSDGSIDPRFTSFGPTAQPWNNIAPKASVNFTFINPGTYSYFCSYHSWMVGSVIVLPGTNSSGASSSPAATTSSSATTSSTAILPRFPDLGRFLVLASTELSVLGLNLDLGQPS